MTFPSWASGETVGASKLNDMVGNVSHVKQLFSWRENWAFLISLTRPLVPTVVIPLGIVTGRYLALAFSATAGTVDSGRLAAQVEVFGQKLEWFDEGFIPITATTTYFKTFDLETITGLPLTDISGLPITLNLYTWKENGGSVTFQSLAIWTGETADQDDYLTTTDNP